MATSGVRHVVDVVALVVLLAIALAWPLHAPLIGAHGEAREGLVVQDVVDRGEWVLPHRNGELPSKPPLFHWIAALATRVIGASDAAVRSPSAIGGAAMLVATYAFGTMLGGRVVAWLAAGALLGTHGFWESAWEARVDMVFAACVTLALVAFYAWYRSGNGAARVGCYLAVACAVLAKGPAGAALPALVIAAFVVRESWRAGGRGTGRVAHARDVAGKLWSWPLVALVLLLDVGWYALAYERGGSEFLRVQLLHENVDRLVGRGVFGMHGGRSRFKMLGELATDLVPWNLALVWAAAAWLRGRRAPVGERFVHAWWILVVAVFTAAYGKRDVYLLPLYPAIALLAGVALATIPHDATRVARVLPVPGPVRRRFPARPALAFVALAVIAFDVALLVTSQVTRVHQARRKSLLSFVPVVAAAVPPDAPLYAAPDLDGSDVQVLAYRLRRPIPRAPDDVARVSAACGDGGSPSSGAADDASAAGTGESRSAAERAPVYLLIPATRAGAGDDARTRPIAVSTRRGTNVALVAIAR